MPEYVEVRKKYASFHNGELYVRYKEFASVPESLQKKAIPWVPKEDGKGVKHWRVPIAAVNATITSVGIRFSDVTKSDELIINYTDDDEPWVVSLSFNDLTAIKCAAILLGAVKKSKNLRIVSRYYGWEIYINGVLQRSPTDYLEDPFVADGDGVKNVAYDQRYGAAWKKAVDESVTTDQTISPTDKGTANLDFTLPTKKRKIVSQPTIKTKFWALIKRYYGGVLREMVNEVAPFFAVAIPAGNTTTAEEHIASSADDLPF